VKTENKVNTQGPVKTENEVNAQRPVKTENKVNTQRPVTIEHNTHYKSGIFTADWKRFIFEDKSTK